MDFYVDKSGFKTSLNDRLQSGDKYDVRRYLKNMTCIGINEIGVWSIEQSSLQHAISSILVGLCRKLVDCQNQCKWKYYSPGGKALTSYLCDRVFSFLVAASFSCITKQMKYDYARNLILPVTPGLPMNCFGLNV